MKFSLEQVKAAVGEAQLLHNWTLNIVKPANVMGNFPENLQIRCTSATMPVPEHSEVLVEVGGHTFNQNGKTVRSGSVEITFVEGTDAAVNKYFREWGNFRFQGTGSGTTGEQAPNADLKADVEMQLMGPNDKVTQTVKLVGVLAKLSSGASLGQGADLMSPGVTLVYDDVRWGAGTSVSL